MEAETAFLRLSRCSALSVSIISDHFNMTACAWGTVTPNVEGPPPVAAGMPETYLKNR